VGGVVGRGEPLVGSGLTDTESVIDMSTSWERDPRLGPPVPRVRRTPLTNRLAVFFFSLTQRVHKFVVNSSKYFLAV